MCERMKFNPLLARSSYQLWVVSLSYCTAGKAWILIWSWQLRKTDPDHRPFDTCGNTRDTFSTWWGRRKRVRSCKRKSAFFLNLARKNKFQARKRSSPQHALTLYCQAPWSSLICPEALVSVFEGVDWSFLFGIGFIILRRQRLLKVSLSCRGGKGGIGHGMKCLKPIFLLLISCRISRLSIKNYGGTLRK
jgi:hypothetical protein